MEAKKNNVISKEKQIEVAKRWQELSKNSGFRESTQKYFICEQAFFSGAIAALKDDEVPPIWLICLMSGRSVSELTLEKEKS